ncbi:MAG: hypothetical protein SFU86_10470 [Pirellulaceae bacterium]|nr:hypothetical protein [Pirellulaceae bacterium]
MADPLFPLLLALRYLHILGAIALMGGTIFMRFGLAPVVAGLDVDTQTRIHTAVRGRWAKFVMLASAMLLVSGIANMILYSSRRYDIEPLLGMKYAMIVGIKFLLALPIFFIAALLTGRSNLAQKIQANRLTWMNINLALALVMVLIGGGLKFVSKKYLTKDPAAAVASEGQEIARQTLSFGWATE